MRNSPQRRRTRTVRVGPVPLGSGHPVVVQSMVKVDPHDPGAVAREADELAELGAGLVRLAVPDREAADAIAEVRRRSRAVLVADVHFDPRLALAAIDAGAHKVRVNPGNLRGGDEAVERIARAAREKGVAVRVGANSGSLAERPKAGGGEADAPGGLAEALARSVIDGARAFERAGLGEIVLSAKGSDALSTVAAGRMIARETDCPVHVGVTAAGPPSLAWAKSAIGIGALLADGIGDTIRVSYTGDPREEVRAGYAILEAVGLGPPGIEIMSCPTCGRTRVDLVRAVERVRAELGKLDKLAKPGKPDGLEGLKGLAAPVTVAVMGCEVNGPGEAREADVGLACGRNGGRLFARGERLSRVTEAEMVPALVALVRDVVRDIGAEAPADAASREARAAAGDGAGPEGEGARRGGAK